MTQWILFVLHLLSSTNTCLLFKQGYFYWNFIIDDICGVCLELSIGFSFDNFACYSDTKKTLNSDLRESHLWSEATLYSPFLEIEFIVRRFRNGDIKYRSIESSCLISVWKRMSSQPDTKQLWTASKRENPHQNICITLPAQRLLPQCSS